MSDSYITIIPDKHLLLSVESSNPNKAWCLEDSKRSNPFADALNNGCLTVNESHSAWSQLGCYSTYAKCKFTVERAVKDFFTSGDCVPEVITDRVTSVLMRVTVLCPVSTTDSRLMKRSFFVSCTKPEVKKVEVFACISLKGVL